MPIRVTAIARHLTDPTNMVYYVDMEGSIWEANVHTLDVKRLFKKPVPGWHGKGGYTSQGRLVVSNNGELHVGSYKDVLVGGEAKNEEERGVLAEWDGNAMANCRTTAIHRSHRPKRNRRRKRRQRSDLVNGLGST